MNMNLLQPLKKIRIEKNKSRNFEKLREAKLITTINKLMTSDQYPQLRQHLSNFISMSNYNNNNDDVADYCNNRNFFYDADSSSDNNDDDDDDFNDNNRASSSNYNFSNNAYKTDLTAAVDDDDNDNIQKKIDAQVDAVQTMYTTTQINNKKNSYFFVNTDSDDAIGNTSCYSSIPKLFYNFPTIWKALPPFITKYFTYNAKKQFLYIGQMFQLNKKYMYCIDVSEIRNKYNILYKYILLVSIFVYILECKRSNSSPIVIIDDIPFRKFYFSVPLNQLHNFIKLYSFIK